MTAREVGWQIFAALSEAEVVVQVDGVQHRITRLEVLPDHRIVLIAERRADDDEEWNATTTHMRR